MIRKAMVDIENVEGLAAIFSQRDLKAGSLQHAAGEIPVDLVVFDKQDVRFR